MTARQCLSWFLIIVLLVTSLGTPASAGESLPDTDAEEVQRLYDEDIVTTFDDGTFRPDHHVTRAEAAVMLTRALEFSTENTWTSFSDVESDHYAAGHIHAVVDRGLMTGYQDDTFQPESPMLRGETAAALYRQFQFDGTDYVSFSDIEGHHYSSYITSLSGSGIIGEQPDSTYRPDESVTRLDFANMLARSLYSEYRVDKEDGTDEPEQPEPETEAIGYGEVVNSPTLNVRPDPSTDQEPIGSLAEGDEVEVLDRTGNWAEIRTDAYEGYVSQSYLIVDYYNHESSLYGKTIAVDPGHGGEDPGAEANGVVEKEVVLDVGLRLEEELRLAGANVIMTRRSDWFPSLEERVQEANQAGADIFVSIHTNAAAATEASGTETFYNETNSPGQSADLAGELQEKTVEKLNTVDRGIHDRNFYVVRETTMPSALAELAFKTNAEEAEYMKTDQFREDSSEALFEGIEAFFH
ncbi:N-acetylmuramoyl-L-alanine amidase [Bacillus daqingensis]|uniref:N-acetylmuramoyl-L-alanine amidase n=1 Tax=Bacillus daqingensis TaxID=872396 RepID=UPI00366A906A